MGCICFTCCENQVGLSMRILVSGAQGFVGRYLVAALRSSGTRSEVFPTSRNAAVDPMLGLVERMDVVDGASVDTVIARIRPTHIVHLAGLSVIAAATANEDLAWQVHLFGTLNIARAIKRHAPQCVLLSIGSGQIYGTTGRSGEALDEMALVAPTNVQMASKAAADLALGAMAEEGLRCVRFRPFNHTGPNQSEKFVLPDFAMQIARIKAGRQSPLMRVGNLNAERDFLDVRDVAMAYVLAVEKSECIEPGTVFNIASGVPRRIRDLLDEMIRMSGASVVIEADTGRVRPGDIPRFVGDASRARRVLGWTPNYSLATTMRDILDHADQLVRKGTGSPQER